MPAHSSPCGFTSGNDSEKEFAAKLNQQLQHELDAFQRKLPSLLRSNLKGTFVALSDGEVIDHDADEFALAERMSQQFTDKFVFIHGVSERLMNQARIQTRQ